MFLPNLSHRCHQYHFMRKFSERWVRRSHTQETITLMRYQRNLVWIMNYSLTLPDNINVWKLWYQTCHSCVKENIARVDAISVNWTGVAHILEAPWLVNRGRDQGHEQIASDDVAIWDENIILNQSFLLIWKVIPYMLGGICYFWWWKCWANFVEDSSVRVVSFVY